MKHERIRKAVRALLEEADSVLESTYRGSSGYSGDYVDGVIFTKWLANCRALLHLLGDARSTPWAEVFQDGPDFCERCRARQMRATLQSLEESINRGLLCEIEEFVLAETFDSLLEQADYLLSQKYVLAAGVLGRAVLEEHLRNRCETEGCVPERKRPTINDYIQQLYGVKVINKIQMKHLEALASIGNDAAHNNPALSHADVERLLRDLRGLLLGQDRIPQTW